jgi:predicted HTH transcriptional regulator
MSKVVWPSKNSEKLVFDPNKIQWLHQLAKNGEGLYLEFKAKATQPDKIVKELIAFANSKGGTLLIGVNDDGLVSGVKYPEEDSLLVVKALNKYCRPRIQTKYYYIRLNEKKWVVVFLASESKRKPVRFLISRNKAVPFIRFEDKTLQASREAEAILHLQSSNHPVSFTYGEVENKILKILDIRKSATLPELQKLTGIQEFIISTKLVHLAAAHVIGWKPQEPNDLFLSIGQKV